MRRYVAGELPVPRVITLALAEVIRQKSLMVERRAAQ
jgi:hypothetical protein